MTNEERDLIQRFIARVGGNPQGGTGGAFGSVPSTAPTNLPPVDPEANQLILQNFQGHPEAPYRITQMAVVQEAALAESQNRIKRLEWELQQTQAQLQVRPEPAAAAQRRLLRLAVRRRPADPGAAAALGPARPARGHAGRLSPAGVSGATRARRRSRAIRPAISPGCSSARARASSAPP